METIMGQDTSKLLTISDHTREGKVSFFVVICILLFVYAIYNVAIIIWSQKKIELLISYKQDLYKLKRMKDNKKPISSSNKKPTPKAATNEEIKEKLSNPSQKDIDEAMENLNYFHRKKYLKG